ncbi:Leucine rich repeat/Leucine Rich Repeat/Leucine Rich repeat [Novymonas esmeraldas]|uniref:Leucine rich repeat/Leucine Rich Repeat/Leucine Rich repeat n=1 Tax=Novymonas esmeraldas TaxID=1808958 RepID=A0AAW0F0M5_9TRYP
MARVTKLDASVNELRGRVPAEWGSMFNLRYLYLRSNGLTGPIPATVGSLNLFTVDIRNNQLCGCASSRWLSSYFITLRADPAMHASNCSTVNACAVDESSSVAERATLAFLQGFAVSMPSLQSTWADTRYCAWPGVMCNTDDTVTLDLSGVALTAAGSLPEVSDGVDGSLIPLTQVRISGKGAMVSGSLPASWGRLTRLKNMNLTGNALTGPLPADWRSLIALRTVNLGNNALSGTLPAEWSSWTGLETLDLSNNALTGPLLLEWRSWTGLQTLNLSNNALTGPLPAEWSSWTGMWSLDLSNNALTGSLPSEWSSWTGMWILNLDSNRLSGTLPVNWSSWTEMQKVNLGNNALSGSLPTMWGTLRWLSVLNVSRNALNGALPANWSSMKYLTSLDLSVNTVHGTLPEEWSNIHTLRQLHLNNNELTGTIPRSMGLLSLSTVDISRNQFAGCALRQWRESCSITLRADPPMTTGVCGAGTSCGVDGGHDASSSGPSRTSSSSPSAPSTSGKCEVSGCERCEIGAPHVCAQCQSGYTVTGTKTCQSPPSGVAADARAGAVVAAVTCAVLAFSLALTL